ncbi:FKBP-type peptidyl-prolyl cis-trans isomerase [Actinokineospora pegani]|uniref:FKBP-type peptidyl-prolyl cis-trans isomerase n=1 Tax=Actinokineospora pegani TaxID=2654637 RepID=UPI0012E9B7C2|nr:FKBP-type peptidyl-prolyl cis-trans isomerase [Actinokineospora pegani]
MRTVGKTLIVAALAAGLAACGNAEEPSVGAVRTTATLSVCSVDDVEVGGAFGAEPTVTIPDTCSPPTELLSKDLAPGTGTDVTAGVTMLTDYHLVAWSTKSVADSSFARGEPFPLENVGQAGVIDGWNEGLIGMKEGGRRLLVVPPAKGYGARGQGQIKPNETLVFVIDAVRVS